MHVDGLGEHQIVPSAPDVIEDARPILHGAFVAEQEFEERILLGRERDLVRAPANLLRIGIEGDVPCDEHGSLLDTVAPQERLHTRQKLGKIEGLGEVVVRADIQPVDDLRLLAARGEHEDGHVLLILPQHRTDDVPVHAGEIDVENDEIHVLRHGELEALLAVGGDGYDVVFQLEELFDVVREFPLIFDEEDMHEGCERMRGL